MGMVPASGGCWEASERNRMYTVPDSFQQRLPLFPPLLFQSIPSPKGVSRREGAGWDTSGIQEWCSAWITPVLCFQASMEFPGPGIFLAPSPIGLVRKVMRRAILVPARREYRKVSTAVLPSSNRVLTGASDGRILHFILKSL